MNLKWSFQLTALLVLLMANSLSGQNGDWDYPEYPWMPVEYRHLDAEIRISQSGLITGDILYTLEIKDEQADSLFIDAPGVEIINVEVESEPVSHSMRRDRLVVQLPQRYERGSTLSLRIQYRANPDFGIHQSVKGTLFTSNLPFTTSHWLPVADHPAVEFTAEFIFIHPASREFIMNGRRGDETVVSLDEEAVVYSINKPVSPIGLNWVLGDLEYLESTLNPDWQSSNPEISAEFQGRSDPQIHLYSEVETMQTTRIFNEAAVLLDRVQKETGIAYPFRDLQIVLLQDDYWETKPYGAGIIYLFYNQGDLIYQVRRSVISQWFGAKLRERQWSEPRAIQMLQAWQLSRKGFAPDTLMNTPAPYSVFENSEIMPWIHFFESNSDSTAWNSKLSDVVNNLFIDRNFLLSYNTFAQEIYTVSGRSYFNGIYPDTPSVESSNDTHKYIADISLNTQTGMVEIRFEAAQNPLDELVSITANIITLTGSNTQQLTFTGEDDTIVLSVTDLVENVTLEVNDSDLVKLDIYKPFEFWIYQLQSGETSEQRVEAATKLSEYSENPDLQLALTDIIRQEDNASVQAEILKTLSAVTRGAAGTEQFYLQRLSNQYPDEVRMASIESLAAYSGNDQVTSRLRSVLYEAEISALRRASVNALSGILEADSFLNIMESLITEEKALEDVPFILNRIAEKGNPEEAVRFSETFISANFPYNIRKSVLDLMIQYDNSKERWSNRLESLLFDKDPRIRYYSADAMSIISISEDDVETLMDRRLPEEYDERVRRKLLDFFR